MTKKEERQARREERKANRKPFNETVLGTTLTKLVPSLAVSFADQVPILGDVVKAIQADGEASADAKAEALSLVALEQEDRISARYREAAAVAGDQHWFWNKNWLMNCIGLFITVSFVCVMTFPFVFDTDTMSPELLDFIEENRILVGNLMMGIVGYYWGASHREIEL